MGAERPLTPAAFASLQGATDTQMTDLMKLHGMVVEANQVMNLVAPSTLEDYWRRHVLDSAQLFHVEQEARVWADIGSGAGFPGLVLAILLKGRPQARVHLIESMGKRVRFLNTVCQRLALPTAIHHARAEAVKPPPALEVVTARACAPLPRLLGYTAHFFSAGARGLFLKGRDAETELTEARRSWTFRWNTFQSESDPSGRLVRIEDLARRA